MTKWTFFLTFCLRPGGRSLIIIGMGELGSKSFDINPFKKGSAK